ncbi:hypothetical protein CK203_018961 [Vitis vinifera]|uniref:Retrovirus-related Pol polyprotein from transposon 17.6 n=1 Tax=Vitis vinifera TaxID=29760 RepID=A0A438IQY8_VITVI|nr:hypothetical protein CK203_018961 [Vitis vinifera]
MIDGVVPHDEYRDEMDMMTVSQITGIVQLQPVSAFDMFGVSTIEVFEGTQTLPVPELPEDDSSLFEGIVSPVEGASDLVDPPLSFDVLSGFVSRSDDVSVASFMDLSIFEYSPVSCDNERVSPAAGDVETVDFGTEDQPRELKIGSPLSTDERDRLIHLLRSYLDVFAWSYEDMPGLDPSIVQHHLPTLPHARPIKQKLRRLHPRWSLQVKEEIQKQLSVGFISVVEYPEWLANVVPVPKNDGKVRVCVDFRDLNKPALKMTFPFHTLICWLMAPVMPFGLKNAGATYQRVATTLFHDMMHRDVEVYVDDMIVKSRGRADHLDALERFFERIRKNQPTVWNDDCQFAFEKIKEYLLSPPVLVPPTPGRPLLLYLSVSDMALGSPLLSTSLGYQEIEALHDRIDEMVRAFDKVDIQYVSQKSIMGSIVADHLASLPTSEDRPVDDDFPDEEFVAMTSLSGWCLYFDGAANQLGYGIGVLLGVPSGRSYSEIYIEDQDDLPWYHDIYQFLRSGTYPEIEPLQIRVMREVYAGVCGPHMGGHMLARKIMRTGYFWLTMETDCCQFVQKCPECQIHGDLIHAPPSELHALTSPCPFSVWGIDIIGKVSPKSSSGHEFILVAIDYFTKWVEAASYARSMAFDHHRSSAYRPQTNRAVEAANKNIKRILRKMVETSRDWSEKLPFACGHIVPLFVLL